MHGLTPVGSGVDHRPEPRLQNAFGARHVPSDEHDLAEKRPVPVGRVVERGQVLLGDHQDVCGRLRPDIPEREDVFGFVDDVGGDDAVDDLAEEAVFVRHG